MRNSIGGVLYVGGIPIEPRNTNPEGIIIDQLHSIIQANFGLSLIITFPEHDISMVNS